MGEILHKNNRNEKNTNSSHPMLYKVIQTVYNSILFCIRICFSIFYGKGLEMPPTENKILLESVTSLAEKIRTRQLKSVDVVKAFITRIKEINPMLNCVVEDRFKDALIDARNADELSQKLSENELIKNKPLLGVPFSTKDSIQVKNMLNTAGLWLRKEYRANESATAIGLLQEAGAIPLAITNVPELCMWWETYNTIYGRTNNPYNTNRTAGGSSGGEGCIQAAGGSAFGLGSDMGGSIRMPAFFNGIFGHKPSKYIVSNNGQFPPHYGEEQNSFLSIGPMCRHATDLKLILKVIANDKAKILNLDEPVNLKNVNFFYQIDNGGTPLLQFVEKEIRETLQKVVKYLSNKFDEIPQRVQFEKLRESFEIFDANIKNECDIGAAKLLTNLQSKINPYIEFGKFVIGQSKHTFMGLLNAIFERFETKHGTPIYFEYVEKRNELLKEIQDLLGDNGVLLYPTHPTVAPYHCEPIARALNFSYTAIFNCLGLPCTTIPLGIGSEGLPLGIQVIANHNQDRLCFAVAEELEKAFGGWVAPTNKM